MCVCVCVCVCVYVCMRVRAARARVCVYCLLLFILRSLVSMRQLYVHTDLHLNLAQNQVNHVVDDEHGCRGTQA